MLISTLLRVAMVSFTIILMGNIPLPRARKILTYHNPVFLKIVKNSKKKNLSQLLSKVSVHFPQIFIYSYKIVQFKVSQYSFYYVSQIHQIYIFSI